MKRAVSFVLLCALALGLLPGCAGETGKKLTARPEACTAPPIAPQADAPAADTAGLSGFGLELLKEARRQEGGQVLLSPLSVLLALSMAANGAEGETLAQLESVLAGGASLEELNAACARLIAAYQSPGGSTRCSIANSVWLDPAGAVSDEFVGRCIGTFSAQAFRMSLSDQAVVPALNGWVSEHTGGLIPKIVDEPFDGAAALLVNALYLKNTWASEFDPNDTRERTFRHRDGREERMDFLGKHDVYLSYLRGEGAQGVLLPYDDGRLGFFALMPELYPDAPELEQWLEGLDGEALAGLLSGARDALFLSLRLPKFQAEWNGGLSDVLVSLGLDLAFDRELADFSRLGDHPEGYYISQVIHAARLEVNEKGTEAAAATVVEIAPGGAPAPPDGITLIFDRPFLYGIVDLETGFPLFLGTFE